MRSRPRSRSGRSEGPPQNPVAWLISTARHKAIDQLRRRVLAEGKRDEIAALAAAQEDTPVPLDSLRLIFTCCHPALAPEAQVALTLRTIVRPRHRGDRARLPRAGADAGAAARARQGEDRRARIPYEVPGDDVLAERLDAVHGGRLPGVQRGLRGQLRRRAGARRAVRRGDPARPHAGRAAAGRARAEGLAGVDAAPRCPPRHAHRRRGRAGAARGPGPLALGPREDRRGRGAGRAGPARPGAGRVRRPGRDRRAARAGAVGRRDRLAADRGALRRARGHPSLARGRAQPRRGDRDGRRPRAGPGAARARSSCPATTCCRPRARTCCAGWAAATKPPPRTGRRSALVTNEAERRFLERRLAELGA